MVDTHRTRAFVFAIALTGWVISSGCLTLTTSEGSNGNGGASGSSGILSGSSSSGVGVDCATIQDCPTVMWCQTMACVNGSCVSGVVETGTPCNDNKVCDGDGSCVECVFDSHCSGTSATCQNNTCISCSDGIKNGDETGIDCGGSQCAPCTGMPCSNSNECQGNYCVDGVCCNTPCTQICKACNVAGSEGTCTNLPMGVEDPGKCDTTKACAGGSTDCLLKNGEPCTSNGNCISDNCVAGICEP